MTNNNLLRILKVSVTGLVAVGLLMGQITMTRIRGTVVGTDGNPVADAEVQFERTDIRANYKINTNSNGEFDYPTLPLGMYVLKVVIAGENVYEMRGIATNPQEPLEMNIDLAEQPAMSEADLSEAERLEYERQLKEAEELAAKDKALQNAFNLGMQAAKAKDWNGAIENLEVAGELDPEQIAIWGNLAEAYMARGDAKTGDLRQMDYDKGVAAYEKATLLAPIDPNYQNNLGLAHAKAGHMDRAEAALGKAAELNPTNGGTYFFNLGALLYNSNQVEPAENAFRKAIEMQPTHADSWFQLGTVLISQATFADDGSMVTPEGTKDAFDKYLELAPNGVNADAAKGMLQALDSTIETTITQ